MRRTPLVLCLSSALLAGGVALSQPALATTVQAYARSAGTVFNDLDLTPCAGANTAAVKTVSQSTGSHGTGALQLSVGSNGDSEAWAGRAYSSPVPVSAFTLDFDARKVPTLTEAQPYVIVMVDRDGNVSTTTDVDMLVTQVNPGDSAWAAAAPLSGTFDDGESTTSWATYVSATPNGVVLEWALDIGCDDPTSPAGSGVWIDNLVMSTGPNTVADYEIEAPTTLTVSGGTTVVAGSAATLTAVLKNGTMALAGKTLTLWAKPYGATAYAQVGSGATNASGVLSLPVKPLKQTSYQFRIASNEPTNASAASGMSLVNVKTKITKNVFDTTVTTSQLVQTYGLTYPAKPGAVVYLYRGSVAIASARVASDGTYLVQARITTRGTHSVTTRGAAGTGNLAGISAPTTVTVS